MSAIEHKCRHEERLPYETRTNFLIYAAHLSEQVQKDYRYLLRQALSAMRAVPLCPESDRPYVITWGYNATGLDPSCTQGIHLMLYCTPCSGWKVTP